ncbi:FmdE family protein [Methanobacterium alcaliphilum]|uniref:FmdE family protein n=1 Tax=Methanobacterium alcaliphilum TaxID=392018 RepID=UPI00200A6B86|nr:FmdE family protein [Methanobacterium alcaliphilum]MCK9151064.1 FmdE family protein [Methanobacterium alcaliphilum]
MQKIIPFSEVTKFHGHVCPGTAIGYRAAKISLKELQSDRPVDEEFLTIVENDSCSVDAIQVVTGCTLGKGNLIFKDYGKQVYTFLNRNTGKSIRLSLKKSIDELDSDFSKIRTKAFSKEGTHEDKLEFKSRKNDLSEKILEMSADELFKLEHVTMEEPEEARLFQSIKCEKCGDYVAEHRARIEEGNIVCIPCFKEYNRN